jgi:hypothetical protein
MVIKIQKKTPQRKISKVFHFSMVEIICFTWTMTFHCLMTLLEIKIMKTIHYIGTRDRRNIYKVSMLHDKVGYYSHDDASVARDAWIGLFSVIIHLHTLHHKNHHAVCFVFRRRLICLRVFCTSYTLSI